MEILIYFRFKNGFLKIILNDLNHWNQSFIIKVDQLDLNEIKIINF